jgi:hypothetical protein
MNFTLDGLEEVIFDTTLNYKPCGSSFSDPLKQEYYRRKDEAEIKLGLRSEMRTEGHYSRMGKLELEYSS